MDEFVRVTNPHCYIVTLSIYATQPLTAEVDIRTIRWRVLDLEYLVKGKDSLVSILPEEQKPGLLAYLTTILDTSDVYESLQTMDLRLRKIAIVGTLNVVVTQAKVLQHSYYGKIISKVEYEKEKTCRVFYWAQNVPAFPGASFLEFQVVGCRLHIAHCPDLPRDSLPDFDPEAIDLASVLDVAIKCHASLRLAQVMQSHQQVFGAKMEIDDGGVEDDARVTEEGIYIYVLGDWNVTIRVTHESGTPMLRIGNSDPKPWNFPISKLWTDWTLIRIEVLEQKIKSALAVKGLSLSSYPLQYSTCYYATVHEAGGMFTDLIQSEQYTRSICIGQIAPSTGHTWSYHLQLTLPNTAIATKRYPDLVSFLKLNFLLFENQYEAKNVSVPVINYEGFIMNLWQGITQCEKLAVLLSFPILCLAVPDFDEGIWTQMNMSFRLVRQNESYPVTVSMEKGVIKLVLSDYECTFPLYQNQVQVQDSSSQDQLYTLHVDSRNSQFDMVIDPSRFYQRKSRISRQGLEKLESLLDILRTHRIFIGEPLSSTLSDLQTQGNNVNVVTLTHDQACFSIAQTYRITYKAAVERAARGTKAIFFTLNSTPRLPTSSIVDQFTYLGDPFQIAEALQGCTKSAQFQLCLSEALGLYAQSASVLYNSDSYETCGFHVIPTDYESLSLTYLRSYIVKFRAKSVCCFEIYEPGYFCPKFSTLDKFVDMLHHCFSRTVGKDQALTGSVNSVCKNKPKLPQVLNLHKPQYVTESLLLILEFMNTQHILKQAKAQVTATLRNLYGDPACNAANMDVMALNINLSDRRLTAEFACDWQVKLETSRGMTPLILKLMLTLKGPSEKIYGAVITSFYDHKVMRVSMSQPLFLIRWMQVLVLPEPKLQMFVNLMEHEGVYEVRYEWLQVFKEELRFPVKCTGSEKVFQVMVTGPAQQEQFQIQGCGVYQHIEEISEVLTNLCAGVNGVQST